MIALDSSALIAIARGEPEAPVFMAAIDAADLVLIGTPTLLEVRMVAASRFGKAPVAEPLALIVPEDVRIVDFDQRHLREAIATFDRYGKGRHPASLNFGDCMAYAVARVAGCPLLYKGDDFARTDIRSAVAA